MAIQRIKQTSLCNYEIVESEGLSGGLWLMWDDEYNLKVLEKNSNLIVAEVLDNKKGASWLLMGVYGDPSRVHNQSLWDHISSIIDDREGPVCLVGDFNALTSESEKAGGSSGLSSNNANFKLWLNSSGLIDMGYHGPAFTWTNKRAGKANIAQRLDRVVATLDWTLKFPKAMVLHLPRFSSDHSPILVRMDSRAGKATRTFRCENWWLECEGFDEVCKEAVQAGQGNWGRIKQLFRKGVIIWASQRSSPDSTLRNIENQMVALNQMPDDPQAKALEGKLQANHDRCLKIQEIFWHQRARLNWAIGGDQNSRFFHAMAVV